MGVRLPSYESVPLPSDGIQAPNTSIFASAHLNYDALIQTMNMASFIGIHPANSQRMADASAQLMYQKGLGSAYSRMQHNWEAATVS
ncbi:TPA: hypothetical protein ACH3X3_005003 [Trebouxia sp. C0006]